MAKKVLIAFQPAMQDELDQIAQEEGRTRSELLRECVRQYIERHRIKKAQLAMPHVMLAQPAVQ